MTLRETLTAAGCLTFDEAAGFSVRDTPLARSLLSAHDEIPADAFRCGVYWYLLINQENPPCP